MAVQTDGVMTQLDAAERALNEAGIETLYAPGFVPDLAEMIRKLAARVPGREAQEVIEELEDKITELEDQLSVYEK